MEISRKSNCLITTFCCLYTTYIQTVVFTGVHIIIKAPVDFLKVSDCVPSHCPLMLMLLHNLDNRNHLAEKYIWPKYFRSILLLALQFFCSSLRMDEIFLELDILRFDLLYINWGVTTTKTVRSICVDSVISSTIIE